MDLKIRKTHRYVGEYQHLDEWESIGNAEEIANRIRNINKEKEAEYEATIEAYQEGAEELGIPSSMVSFPPEPEYDMCEPLVENLFVQVTTQETDDKRIEQALRDTNTSWGCSHEYDCCGCRSYMVSNVVKHNHGVWQVVIHSSRNF